MFTSNIVSTDVFWSKGIYIYLYKFICPVLEFHFQLRQKGGEIPDFPGSRIMTFSWWIFCFFVITTYGANLTANLTKKDYSTPFETASEVLVQTKVKFGMHAALWHAIKVFSLMNDSYFENKGEQPCFSLACINRGV